MNLGLPISRLGPQSTELPRCLLKNIIINQHSAKESLAEKLTDCLPYTFLSGLHGLDTFPRYAENIPNYICPDFEALSVPVIIRRLVTNLFLSGKGMSISRAKIGIEKE